LKNRFDPDQVLPIVSEVVLVEELLSETELEVREFDSVWIIAKREAAPRRDAILFTVNEETVEMEVAPGEGDLEGMVEIGDG